MTSNYTGPGWSSAHPADYVGQPASVTKTGKRTKPPTAGKDKYIDASGLNVDDAMQLSPMVEREIISYPTNFAVILLTLLFVLFVIMRK
jgi:hypothetical protein